jgi:ABC-type glutathione transport system ATPase component
MSTMEPQTQPLLEARITVRYGTRTVLDDLHLAIQPGEIVGLVGQSGSGKSTLGLSLVRLIDRRGGAVAGEIHFDGRDLLTLREREMRPVRGKQLALVLQSAASALNPELRLEDHFREAWAAHSREPWQLKRAEALALFGEMDLPAQGDSGDAFFRSYPGQISVGQAQRVLIALALLHKPKLIIADELTSALDLITSAGVLEALRRANRIWGTAILFVSHDLGAVASLCHRVAILNSGRIIETAPTSVLFAHPQQPYTQQLVSLMQAVSGAGSAALPISNVPQTSTNSPF